MGIKTKTDQQGSLVDALFSGTKQRVLGILFSQPDRSFYANEIIRLAACGSGAVQRELTALAASGLIRVRPVGNQKHYQANPDSPIFSEICSIIQKTVGLADPLRKAIAPLASQVTAAFVYGSVAKGTDTASSDIDLMLISDDLDYASMFAVLEEVGRTLGREVNPTILSQAEFQRRREHGEAFLTRVLAQPKVWLVRRENELGI